MQIYIHMIWKSLHIVCKYIPIRWNPLHIYDPSMKILNPTSPLSCLGNVAGAANPNFSTKKCCIVDTCAPKPCPNLRFSSISHQTTKQKIRFSCSFSLPGVIFPLIFGFRMLFQPTVSQHVRWGPSESTWLTKTTKFAAIRISSFLLQLGLLRETV